MEAFSEQVSKEGGIGELGVQFESLLIAWMSGMLPSGGSCEACESERHPSAGSLLEGGEELVDGEGSDEVEVDEVAADIGGVSLAQEGELGKVIAVGGGIDG